MVHIGPSSKISSLAFVTRGMGFDSPSLNVRLSSIPFYSLSQDAFCATHGPPISAYVAHEAEITSSTSATVQVSNISRHSPKVRCPYFARVETNKFTQ
jgi:hypothetical protein